MTDRGRKSVLTVYTAEGCAPCKILHQALSSEIALDAEVEFRRPSLVELQELRRKVGERIQFPFQLLTVGDQILAWRVGASTTDPDLEAQAVSEWFNIKMSETSQIAAAAFPGV